MLTSDPIVLAGRMSTPRSPICLARLNSGTGTRVYPTTSVELKPPASRWSSSSTTLRYYQRFGLTPSGPLGIYYRPAAENDPNCQVRRPTRFDPSLRGHLLLGTIDDCNLSKGRWLRTPVGASRELTTAPDRGPSTSTDPLMLLRYPQLYRHFYTQAGHFTPVCRQSHC